MEKRQLEEYLSSGYKDYKSFRQNVILPVFGVERFRDGYGADILKNQPELQQLADTTGICRVLSVGEIKLNEIDSLQIFDITVSDRVKIVRNRSSLQRLIRRAMDVHTSAFMIFHYEDAHWDWRFTYCHKGGGGDEFTNSKRYTFLLGPGEWKSCHTAAEHFMTIYEKQGSIEIKDIEEAFSVEALSKEFFKQYKFYYGQFVAYLSDEVHGMRKKFVDKDFDKTNLSLEQVRDREEKPIRDYVKKLLGRIVFLHFLQKKGWLGVPADKEWGDGDRDFMLHLFEHATPGQKANFLDEILEPLFNDAFDTNRSSDDKNDLYDTKVEGFRSVKIPYLNGGLFERDPLDENESHFPSKYFDDLLTTFSQYNFTIDENDPDDAEVGVDPEMLGRIFENLLEDNKDKGAFYTPKEIVRYMCRESLIAYLQTDFTDDGDKEKIRNFVISPDIKVIGDLADKIDKKLREVKICDPAIGSGAFPMGLLKELFYCRREIEHGAIENAAKIKREIIQNNIYGVDIEKGAVDIARLRFWLSLIVDEESPDTLPNLDFKIMQGNSLLEQYQGFDLSKLAADPTAESHFDKEGLGLLYDPLLDDPRRELRKKLEKYYSCDDHDEKRDLREEIKENVYEQLELSREEIKDIDATTEFFLWHTWFYDVFSRPMKAGFDIVIGNPPYGAKYDDETKKIYKKTYRTAQSIQGVQKGSLDTYTLFIELGYNMLCKNGVFAYIVPISLTSSDSLAGVHRLLMDNCDTIRISSYAVRPKPVFENAVVNTSICMSRKTLTPNRHLYSTKMYRRGNNFNLQRLIDNLQFVDAKGLTLYGRIPKIGTTMEVDILRKLFSKQKLSSFLDPHNGTPIYYRTTGGRYFKVVTNYSTGSTKEKSILFRKDLADSIGCILSGSLSFWFYQIYSNNLDWKSYEIENFTIPAIDSNNMNHLNKLYACYLKEIEANANVRTTSGASSYKVKDFKEYKIVRSKAIIDEIDDYICPLYGLTQEETDFIKNYELEFRLSGE